MIDIWEDDRSKPRAKYIVPCLLRDTATSVYLKAVLLDLSATGCRVFTNDRRVQLMTEKQLVGKEFLIEFDFYDLDTGDIRGRVVNVHAGKDPVHERQFGIDFIDINKDVARELNRRVSAAAG